MTTTLTDVATFTSPIVVPADGDVRNAASVQTPFQSLANRTQYLYSKRLRKVGSLSALVAITDYADGELYELAPGFFYWFDAASTETSGSIFIKRPTNIANDGIAGRFICVLRPLMDLTDANYPGGKLGYLGYNAVIDEQTLTDSGSIQAVTSSTYADVANMSGVYTSATLKGGETVHLKTSLCYSNVNSLTIGARIVVVPTSTGTPAALVTRVLTVSATTADEGEVNLMASYTVPGANTDTFTFKLQAAGTASTTWNIRKPSMLNVRVIRP